MIYGHLEFAILPLFPTAGAYRRLPWDGYVSLHDVQLRALALPVRPQGYSQTS